MADLTPLRHALAHLLANQYDGQITAYFDATRACGGVATVVEIALDPADPLPALARALEQIPPSRDVQVTLTTRDGGLTPTATIRSHQTCAPLSHRRASLPLAARH